MSLYTVLDISEDASDFELEQAFRSRSLQFLPTLDSRDHREFYAVSDAFQILRNHRTEYNTNSSNLYWLSDQLQLTVPAVEYFCLLFGMPQMEPFIGTVPVLHWMLNLAPEFPFVDREIKRVPLHILNMLDRARDKRPYDSSSARDHNSRYHRNRSRDAHSLFIDPYLRRVSAQAYVLERGQEIDVSKQVDRLRFLLDVDRDGDGNFWEQKWASFDQVHNRNEDSEDDEDEEEETQEEREKVNNAENNHVTCHVTSTGATDSTETLTDDMTAPASPTTTRRFGGRLRSFVKRHTRGRERYRPHSRQVSREGSATGENETHQSSTSRDESTTRASSLDSKHRPSSPDLGRYKVRERGSESHDSSEVCDRNDSPRDGGGDGDGQPGEIHGFSTTFLHRFQNELNLICEHPFAPSVFQATGTMFKLRSKCLVRQYLPNLPFRGSHFEQTKQSARAILLMDRCVDAKDRCLKINDFWGKYGLSHKDQVNFMYTTCFYELIREVAMNVNRIISQLFEDDEAKVRRKFKRQRAHRLWEMGDWLVKRGAEMAAKRGINVTHNPAVKPDDVVSSIVAVVSYMEFVVINHRPYQTQTRINYAFEKAAVSGDGHEKSGNGDFHVTGDKSNPIHKAAASLWTPWAVASCNPLALADPQKAEEFSSFDFRYEDVFKKKKDQCECGVALFK
ncbi:hypothetical protein B0I75DRAFT_135394 [Yarrowia lipolytica]|nr:hypothetical protein B0I74DRAFT_134710 [Yarrowia lipolytica]RDW53995.1 hypothetical protein B0I75DRAFT_135394 [Yarrowia lipolytica]